MGLFKKTLFFVLLFVSVKTQAQIPVYIQHEIGNGLPSNELYSVMQDSKGLLWIGSEAGLIRYNGIEFKLYTNSKQLGASITEIQEDEFGTIWCHNFSGQILYIQNDTLKIFKPWEKYHNGQLIEMVVDRKRIIISNNNNPIYSFNVQTHQFEKLLDDTTYKRSITISCNGNLFFTNPIAGKIFELKNKKTTSVPIVGSNSIPIQKMVTNSFLLFKSKKNKTSWGIQRQSPFDLNPSIFQYLDNQLIAHPISAELRKLNIYPITVFDDDEGNVFIGTYNGCFWFKEKNNVLYLENSFFKNEAVSSIFRDTEGSYWFTTLKNGLYQIPNLQILFFNKQQLNLEPTNLGLLSSNKKNILFVASNGNELLEIDIEKNKVAKRLNTGEVRDVLSMIYNEKKQELYFYKNSFFIYKNSTKKYTKLLSAPKDFYLRKDGVLFSAGVILQASFEGNTIKKEKIENEFKVSNKLVTEFDNQSNAFYNSYNLSNQRSRCVWYDEKDNTLWCGFSDGTKYFTNKKEFKFYDNVLNMPITSTCFQQLSNGIICIGTIEHGIYFVQNKKIITRFTTESGLLSNRIKNMIPYDKYLWIITSKGVQRFDYSNNQFSNFTTSTGLLSNEVFDIEIVNNTTYLSTSKGLQYFPTNINITNKISPTLSLISFSSSDSVYTYLSNPKISYNATNIAFEVLGTSLKSRNSFSYEYRIMGIDTNWVQQSANNNIIHFTSLPSGNYTFECRVNHIDGTLSNPIKQSFEILKPWWLQTWFFVTVSFLLLCIIYVLFKFQNKYLTKKNNEKIQQAITQEALRNSQLSALKAQMNPHFMFNALNSIQEFIILNEKKQANFYLGKFADLMRLTLDLSTKETISLDDELKILNLYLELENLRFEKNFTYAIHANEVENLLSIRIPAMIIQPYVENAVKHGLLHRQGLKKLDINFLSTDNDTLICTIEDNGIGREKSKEINSLRRKHHTSFATGATQRRLELLNHGRESNIAVSFEDLYNSMGNALGTKVTVCIPLIKANNQ